MAIKTHRQQDNDFAKEQHNCFECGNIGKYWSQDEQPDGQKQGDVIWHCQLHRSLGQLMAKIKGANK